MFLWRVPECIGHWLRSRWLPCSVRHFLPSDNRPYLETLEDRCVPALTVSSINRLLPVGPNTDAASVQFAVVFNQSATGVDASDFQVITHGGVQVDSPIAVTGSGANYTVTISGIHGTGDLTLALIHNTTIVGGNNLLFTGQTYTILPIDPLVISIVHSNPSSLNTTAASVSYTVTFNEAVTGVDPTDFQVPLTGTAGFALVQVTPIGVSGTQYTVTISGITGAGTLGLQLVDDGSIRDLAGNRLTNPSAPSTFQSNQTFPAGSNPRAVAVADVNGDGFLDVVAASRTGGNVSVLLGNGNGTFQAQQTITTISGQYAVAVADVNGDGRPDLIVANYTQNHVAVLLGNGDGTFQTPHSFATGNAPFAIAVADINGDGKPDIIATNHGFYPAQGNTVSVLLGNGDGTFQAQQTLAVGQTPASVAVADVNGDGHPDLIVANNDSNNVSVLLGNGNGTFQAQHTFATGAAPLAVAAADIDGDGDIDLVVANYNLNTVSVLLNNSDGTFQTQKTYGVGSLPNSVAIADVNGDGILDLLVANEALSNNVSVLLGNGDGTFQTQTTVFIGHPSFSVMAADLNGDGRPDIVTVILATNNVNVRINALNGKFTSPDIYTVPAVSLDVDGNGSTSPLTDGILILRDLFGFTGTTLTNGALSNIATRSDPNAITAYLSSTAATSMLDVDGNNHVDPLTDGILILRYLFGFTGTTLTSGALGAGATRTDPAVIQAFLDSFNPSAGHLFADQVGPGTSDLLTANELQNITAAAVARWEATDLSAVARARLESAQVQLANLNGTGLGETYANAVLIDRDAAGYGWFVDPTPQDDSEFQTPVGPAELQAGGNSPASGRMDLLTVVMHELGLVMGLGDIDPNAMPHDLMTDVLEVGMRRFPSG